MKSILLIEDNIKERQSFKKMLQDIDGNLKVYEAQDKYEALEILNNTFIELFFIDIHLKNSSGLDFALELRKIPKYEFSWIVFLTRDIRYMIQAFKEIHCYDYILKPYNKEEIVELTKKLLSAKYNINVPTDENNYVIFEIRQGISIKTYIHQILFIEVSFGVCTLHTKQGKYEIKRLSLKKVLELIDCDDVMRCHRSFAVNINHINKIESISSKVSNIYFNNYEEKAMLSYKFKNIIIKMFNYL